MGLLGAITGYEAQRSREGGVGAALTERDRERREAVRLPYPAGISISPEADRASHSGCPGRAGSGRRWSRYRSTATTALTRTVSRRRKG
jgi:hypothetical protein